MSGCSPEERLELARRPGLRLDIGDRPQPGRDSIPSKIGRSSFDPMPTVFIGKLALDETLHRQSLGGKLLVDALERILLAVQTAAARLVVVDAENENAIGFYKHFGFRRTADDSFRLVQKMSDVAESILD